MGLDKFRYVLLLYCKLWRMHVAFPIDRSTRDSILHVLLDVVGDYVVKVSVLESPFQAGKVRLGPQSLSRERRIFPDAFCYAFIVKHVAFLCVYLKIIADALYLETSQLQRIDPLRQSFVAILAYE